MWLHKNKIIHPEFELWTVNTVREPWAFSFCSLARCPNGTFILKEILSSHVAKNTVLIWQNKKNFRHFILKCILLRCLSYIYVTNPPRPPPLSHFISSSFFPGCSSSSWISGGRGDVSLPVHEALRRRRDVPPPPSTLPPPSVRQQRLQRPVPPPRILLASPEAWAQHLRGLQRHLYPAQPGTASDAQEQAPSRRPRQPAIWLLFGGELPDAPAVSRIPNTLLAQVPLLSPPGPGAPHGSASITRASPSLSRTHAHERLTLLGGGSVKEMGGTVTPHSEKYSTDDGWT